MCLQHISVYSIDTHTHTHTHYHPARRSHKPPLSDNKNIQAFTYKQMQIPRQPHKGLQIPQTIHGRGQKAFL